MYSVECKDAESGQWRCIGLFVHRSDARMHMKGWRKQVSRNLLRIMHTSTGKQIR